MSNRQRLENLLLDIFLLDSSEFRFDLCRDEVETWDSLALVAVAVGIEETFGYHLSQDETTSIQGVSDIVRLLEARGIPLGD